ncbi:hypothetical protein AMTRI_Chr03g139030 [Amborella trichopoda]
MPSSREFNVPPVIFPNPGPQQRRAPSTPFQPQTMPQSRPPNPNPNPNLPFMSFDMSSASASSSSSSHFSAPIYGNPTFEDDLPLLEELGINTRQIYRKTQSILNPFKSNPSFFDDGDLSGPFLYLLLFGLFQLLAGKLHFGIILGWISVSACFIYVAFNMLAGSNGTLTLYTCLSLVGYGMLPIVILSAISLFIPQGTMVMYGLGAFFVMWSTRVCTRLLIGIASYGEEHRGLVAYACCLVYLLFSLLVLF